jgi:uncharacterized protein
LAEEGNNTQLRAAIVCSNPWNLELSSLRMRTSWLNREIYSRALASGLKKYVFEFVLVVPSELVITDVEDRHAQEISQYASLDIEKVQRVNKLSP